jgi:hypothetical protein
VPTVVVSATATLAAKMQRATGADNRQIADDRCIAPLVNEGGPDHLRVRPSA